MDIKQKQVNNKSLTIKISESEWEKIQVLRKKRINYTQMLRDYISAIYDEV